MNKDTKDMIKFIMAMLSGMAFFFGMVSGIGCTGCQDKWDCKPESIATMINIPARLGCELVKKRTWTR